MRMKSGSSRGNALSWTNSEFASWEVEGRVYERVNDVLQDAERHRMVHQALSTEGYSKRNGWWQSVRVAFNKVARYALKVEYLWKARLPANQNQVTTSLPSE